MRTELAMKSKTLFGKIFFQVEEQFSFWKKTWKM